MQIKIHFVINQEVTIKPLGVSGIVRAIHTNSSGTEYLVRYFDHAEQHTEYFLLRELEAVNA